MSDKQYVDDFKTTIIDLITNPNCRKPNCYGRGYVSVTLKDGVQVLNLCECARFKENGYSKLSQRLEGIESSCNQLTGKLTQFEDTAEKDKHIIQDGLNRLCALYLERAKENHVGWFKRFVKLFGLVKTT